MARQNEAVKAPQEKKKRMTRSEEYQLNEAVKKALAELEINDAKLVALGYKLGHKYIDRGQTLEVCIPVIVNAVVTSTDGSNFKQISVVIDQNMPEPPAWWEEFNKPAPLCTPFQELLRGYKLN